MRAAGITQVGAIVAPAVKQRGKGCRRTSGRFEREGGASIEAGIVLRSRGAPEMIEEATFHGRPPRRG